MVYVNYDRNLIDYFKAFNKIEYNIYYIAKADLMN